ncbi:MAG: DUF4342 domain-containing protein [Myxococcaceae bacterium]|nr:DUF4342 domain-containing protein [Myxococcaceae bacterium]MCI0669634.1 DUF4342 domain-containing protein [Myxococcaceae bacterium]
MSEPSSTWERLTVAGDQLAAALKRLVREANVRRVVVKNAHGRTLLDVPITAGAVGFVLAPAWVTVGAIAALVGGLTLEVERVEGAGNP